MTVSAKQTRILNLNQTTKHKIDATKKSVENVNNKIPFHSISISYDTRSPSPPF